MLKHYPKKKLGGANYGWLQTKYHFSFSEYYNPSRMGFGALRVINDDIIKPGFGFEPHPHRNMEIITYVRSGSIKHQDSVGNQGVTKTGEVQVMSAGTGIEHSEYNKSQTPLTLFQIWIEPDSHNVKPRWQTKAFPNKPVVNDLPLLVSGFKEDKGALFIHQKARIYGGRLKKGGQIEQAITNQAYVLASDGSFTVIESKSLQKQVMQKGDGVEVTEIKQIAIKANTDCEVLIIDVPVNAR